MVKEVWILILQACLLTSLKFWYLPSPTCRPRLSLPESEPVELWLAEISL